ncbi:hypothetical protein ACFPYN_11870 [Paenisporosarcina macmurdoensis]|uniref:DUF3796 domain-containing protein n=1 Tax=Paenisporosarcina macmurdoensis TaxID=212659 RepID=A0ABW1L9P2_9BACL
MVIIGLLIWCYYLFDSYWAVGLLFIVYLLTKYWHIVMTLERKQDKWNPTRTKVEQKRIFLELIIQVIIMLATCLLGWKLFGVLFVLLSVVTFFWNYFIEKVHIFREQRR